MQTLQNDLKIVHNVLTCMEWIEDWATTIKPWCNDLWLRQKKSRHGGIILSVE